MITPFEILIYGVVVFLAGIVSGIAGGGAGFITTPLAIFLGLPPAQAVASGKIGGLALSISSLHGLRKVVISSRRRVIAIMISAFVIGLLAPFIIVGLDSQTYRRVLGVLLLAMIPVVILKKIGQKPHKPTQRQTIAGYVSLVIALGLQAVFSGGMGSLVNMALMGFLGMSALEANVTKRYSQLILNSVIAVGVLARGLIYWPFVMVGVVGNLAGGFIGSRLAVKRGNRFVVWVFVVLMFGSALELLFG